MWLIFTRASRPDAAYWPGRRWLAALDAVAWPAMWVVLMTHVPARLGLVGLVAAACVIGMGVAGLHCAVALNHRYQFTTWRWGIAVACLLLVGMLLKLAGGFG